MSELFRLLKSLFIGHSIAKIEEIKSSNSNHNNNVHYSINDILTSNNQISNRTNVNINNHFSGSNHAVMKNSAQRFVINSYWMYNFSGYYFDFLF